MNIYSLPDFRYIESVQIANNPAEVQRLPDYYVGNAGFGAEGRLQVYDKTGKLLFVGSDYPDNGSNVSDNYRFVAYQGYYCTHPTENRYVFAASYSDNIEFHAIRDGKHVLVSENKGDDVVIDSDAAGNAQFVDNTFLGYKGAYGGEKYCYLPFMGKTLKENDWKRSQASDQIYQYSWDGELAVVYKLDKPVVGITVDEKQRYLYGITQDEEGYRHVVRFKL